MLDQRVGFADLVAATVSVGLAVTSQDGRVLWANEAVRGLGGEDVAGLLTAGAGERQWGAPDGSLRWLQVGCRRLDEPTGGLLVYEIADATAAHRQREQAERRERRLSRMETLARVGTWEWDLGTGEVAWSDALLAMLAVPSGTQLDYPSYRSLLHPDDIDLIERTLARALETAEPFEYRHRMYLADRVTLRMFECFGEVLTGPDGRPVRVLGTAHDVTERQRVTDELAYLAEHDPLTGLVNRRALTAQLRERLRDGDRCGALLLLDVDNFKDINDLRGHAVGDQVMRSLALLLQERVGEGAVIGRLGGDEFAVLLPGGDAGDVLAVAESLCDVVARHPIVASGAALRITVSIGVAPLALARDSDVLLANADLALYEAKDAGRNRARLFTPEHYHHAAERVSVVQRVRDALDAGTMALDAQPIFDLATLAVTGHELLIRLRDGLSPPLGPSGFLPAVERTDLILQLDSWVIQRAADALASPAARAAGLRFEVNVSSRSLEDPGFGDFVLATLRGARVEPARLGLEITETAALTSLDAARRLATRLTGEGCHFALDDFGAGFGSFVYLKHLPFTTVKIDGEFVRQADTVAADRVLVDAVVRVARGFDMRTVAEHVDREPLVATLRDLGVDSAQGFHLGRPRPLAELLQASG